MAFTNVYQGSYDDLSEITVNAENMKSAIDALDTIRTDREPTMLRRKISGIRIPDPPPPTPTVTVHTRATMIEESTIPLPSTIAVRPEHAVVEVGSSVLLYAIDLSTEPTVDFVGWFLNDELVSSVPNFAYDIPTTAEGELLFVARYAEKVPVPTVTIKTQATITEGATLPDTVSTKPDCVKVSVGSTVYIGTKDTAEEPTVDFVGWFLNDTLVSADKVFEYTVPESEEPIIFEARYVEKAPITYVNVIAQATMLYPNQVLPDTVTTSPEEVLTTKGSTVVLNTVDTAEDSLIAFVGWYLDNELVSNKAEFAYTVDTTDATLVFTAKYRMVQQALTVQGKVVANSGDLFQHVDFVNDYSFTNNIKAVKYANGTYVALACDNYSALVGYSEDGKLWTVVQQEYSGLAGAEDYCSLEYINGVWFVVGTSLAIVSFDGKTWIELSIGIKGVTSTGNVFVAATADGIYMSDNGITWTKDNNDIVSADSIYYSSEENLFVVCGRDSNNELHWWSGSSWFDLTKNSAVPNGSYGTYSVIKYANGVWVAMAYRTDAIASFCYSINGVSWQYSSSFARSYCLAYLNNLWLIGSEEGLVVSENGTNWTTITVLEGAEISSIIWTGSEYVVSDEYNYGNIYKSTDGYNWTPILINGIKAILFATELLWLSTNRNDLFYSESATYPIDDYATIAPSGTVQIPISVAQEITGTAVQQCYFDHWEDSEGTTLSTDNPYYYTPTAESPLSNTIVAVFRAGSSNESEPEPDIPGGKG